ncbi:MAG: hypothetical protein M0Z60_00715 [Nitrospiraceae bacterium]|nr:hypothetical protein [Nitrospiraceae bacterium]
MKKSEAGEKTRSKARGTGAKRHSERQKSIRPRTLPASLQDKRSTDFHEGQSVELLIGAHTDIGYAALINGSREGLLYANEVFRPLRAGQHISGFIKKVRDDGKIDLCLQKPGAEKVDAVAEEILHRLKARGGFLAVDDNSRPEMISRLFGVSKKTFKKAVGALYRKRLILMEEAGIRLAGEAKDK